MFRNINIYQVPLEIILGLRALYLHACNFQIRYHACHERNWSDSYLIEVDGQAIGYGSVKGLEELADRDAIFEYYLLPEFQHKAHIIFRKLLEVTEVAYIECQSNDTFLSHMLFRFAEEISSEVMLFGEPIPTTLEKPDFIFRPTQANDDVFGKAEKDKGAYVLVKEEEIVADGGFLLHYNPPFADVYMEVKKSWRGQGLASFVVQEIKKACYVSGRVPAARCNINNPASRGSLLNAGFKVVGHMLKGRVRSSRS